jgi:hypothetical protein
MSESNTAVLTVSDSTVNGTHEYAIVAGTAVVARVTLTKGFILEGEPVVT